MIRVLPWLVVAGCCLPTSMKDAIEKKASETVVEKVIESADGVKSAKVGEDGVQIVTDDGTVVTTDANAGTLKATGTGEHGDFAFAAGDGTTVPASFPIPTYPGSAVTLSILQEKGDSTVGLSTPDGTAAVVAWYDGQLPTPASRTVVDDGSGGASFATWTVDKPDSTWTIIVTPNPPQTSVALTVTPK